MHEPFAISRITRMVGTYDATLAVVASPVDRVCAMLPEGLVLADQDVTPPSTHPVVFGFGRHRRAHLAHLTFLWRQSYFEHFTGIPFVNLKASGSAAPGEAAFYYLPRLFLNRFLAVLGGVLWWGFPKRMADISHGDGLYRIRSYRGHEDLLLLHVKEESRPGTLADFPNLLPISQMISQPLIGKSFSGLGPWVASTFDWGWEKAEIRSVKASMRIVRPYLPGLTPATYELPGVGQAHLGGFGVRTRWTLSLPYSPSRVVPVGTQPSRFPMRVSR